MALARRQFLQVCGLAGLSAGLPACGSGLLAEPAVTANGFGEDATGVVTMWCRGATAAGVQVAQQWPPATVHSQRSGVRRPVPGRQLGALVQQGPPRPGRCGPDDRGAQLRRAARRRPQGPGARRRRLRLVDRRQLRRDPRLRRAAARLATGTDSIAGEIGSQHGNVQNNPAVGRASPCSGTTSRAWPPEASRAERGFLDAPAGTWLVSAPHTPMSRSARGWPGRRERRWPV